MSEMVLEITQNFDRLSPYNQNALLHIFKALLKSEEKDDWTENDDYLSDDDFNDLMEAEAEYQRGETISFKELCEKLER